MWRRTALLVGIIALLTARVAVQAPGYGFTPPPGLKLADEGTTLTGRALTLNCVGAGITCTLSGSTGTLTVTGGATSVTQVEIDFDTCGLGTDTVFETCVTTITDAGVVAASKILISQAGIAATGRDADENEMDQITCNALPAAGSFTLTCGTQNYVHGKFTVWYTVG